MNYRGMNKGYTLLKNEITPFSLIFRETSFTAVIRFCEDRDGDGTVDALKLLNERIWVSVELSNCDLVLSW